MSKYNWNNKEKFLDDWASSKNICDFLSMCFNLDNYTFKEIVKFLKEKIGYQKPDSVIEEKDSFEQGKILYQKNSISNIVKKIKSFCLAFRSEKENEKNTFKPK